MVLSTRIDELARQAGFATAGIAAVPEPGSDEDEAERERFAVWVDDGRAGEMEYLKRRDEAGHLLRSSVRVALPWARSVIVCAANYNSADPRSTDPAPEGAGWIARYAWTSSKTENGDRPSPCRLRGSGTAGPLPGRGRIPDPLYRGAGGRGGRR